MPKEIVKRETRWAFHLPKNQHREDYHYVKELVTYSDGTKEPRTFLVENFERPVWVTKDSARSYKDKKEYELVDNLISRKTTESDINRTVAGLLGQPHLATNLDAIKASPYVYGFDVSSTSLIKLASLRRNDYVQSPYSVASFDIETTVDEENREILMASVTMRLDGKKVAVRTCVVQSFLEGIKDPGAALKVAVDKYLPQYQGKLDLHVTFHRDAIEMLTAIFKTCNEWAPDLLAIWNMDFDIRVILDYIKSKGKYATDIICDQSVPFRLRNCRYSQGVTKKVTASGVVKPVNPSLQWHKFYSTSTFQVIDAMCTYRQLRMGRAEEPSYSLDAILKKELNTQKLTFTQADEYKGAMWHVFMQENYPIEYIVYNIYDCLSMLELDEKTNDLSRSLPDFAGITDFSRFNSQSRKLSDALFLFGLRRNRIIGTAGPFKEEDEIDDSMLETDGDDDDDYNNPDNYDTLALRGWIQLLPQSLLVNDGLEIFEDAPHLKTNMRGLVSDMDSVSSYPSATNAANVSKETTVNEIISMEGVNEEVFRQQNLGICLGDANLLEYFNVMFDMPSLESVSEMIDRGEL